MVSDEKMDTLRELSHRLITAEKTHVQLRKSTQKQMGHLADLIAETFSHDKQTFREEYAKLEDQIADFIKNFKVLKQDIFSSTRKALKSEKLKRLLTS